VPWKDLPATEYRGAHPGENVTEQDKLDWKDKVLRSFAADDDGSMKPKKENRISAYRHLLAKDSQLQPFVPGGLKYFKQNPGDISLVVTVCSL
jgi:hypothetical protein